MHMKRMHVLQDIPPFKFPLHETFENKNRKVVYLPTNARDHVAIEN